ncbi:MAG: hypothetical protein GY868_15815, partial [Deltaproteobacteria bacterium]|nr:hypothetical protein [Deltaproteobacteria bacterium]
MKIKTQISAVIISIVILSVCVAVTTAVTGIKLRNRDDSEQYRREELQRTKQKLKNQVTTAYTTIEANHRNAGDKEFLQKHYGHRLKNIIDVAETVLRQKTRLVDNGTLTLAEAQRRAIREIKAIRYDDGTGYIWINDTKRPYPMMIMHPTTPSLDGTVLDDQKRHCTSDTGENVFQLFVERGRTQGEGFVLYRWPKPTREGLVTDVQKLSYVRLFQDWGWIIGTGIYVDDALTDAL